MAEVDAERAAHCLEDLGTITRGCKIMKELVELRLPTEACEGWSIRDTLWEFLVQCCEEYIAISKKRPKRARIVQGQIQALGYSVALIDAPYRPEIEETIRAARLEAESRA